MIPTKLDLSAVREIPSSSAAVGAEARVIGAGAGAGAEAGLIFRQLHFQQTHPPDLLQLFPSVFTQHRKNPMKCYTRDGTDGTTVSHRALGRPSLLS